jgi:hypothetical protein
MSDEFDDDDEWEYPAPEGSEPAPDDEDDEPSFEREPEASVS